MMDRNRKVLLWVLGVVVVLFVVVAAAGAAWHSKYRTGYGMMGGGMMGGYGGYGRIGMHDGFKRGWNGNQVFGVIKTINGNTITITDNAGATETVTTQATTSIVSATGTQVGLSALKVGQNIVVSGTTNSNNQLVADLISLQQ